MKLENLLRFIFGRVFRCPKKGNADLVLRIRTLERENHALDQENKVLFRELNENSRLLSTGRQRKKRGRPDD